MTSGRRCIWLVILLALVQAAANPHQAVAQGADVSESVAQIARELNCPVCQGYNLQDCPLPVCAQMREVIRERLEQGETQDEILSAFVAEYGPQVLNAPPKEGVFWAAWLLPLGVLVTGALGALWWLRRPGVAALVSPGATASVDPHQAARLERLAAGDAATEEADGTGAQA